MIRVKVAHKALLAENIASFELILPDGANLPEFSAGSHIDVEFADSLIRQYSLCNDPAERHRYIIGVLREEPSRGGSSGLHDAIHTGAEIAISVPRNLFPLVAGPHHTLLFAGGIGITPLLSMAEHLAGANASFDLHYCCRTRSRAAFHERIAQSRFAARTTLHFEDEGAGQTLQPSSSPFTIDRPTSISAVRPASSIMSWAARGRSDGTTPVCTTSSFPRNPRRWRAIVRSRCNWRSRAAA